MNDDPGNAGVSAPPPLIFAGALALGFLLERTLHVGEPDNIVAKRLGTAAIAGGVLLSGVAIASFKRAGTNVSPYGPSTEFVARGVFSFTRNPMYVGATSVYIGIALRTRSIPALVLLPVALALIDSGVVDREERYLERRFGDTYRAYRERVPRWF